MKSGLIEEMAPSNGKVTSFIDVMKSTEKSKMGASTFFGKLHPGDVCGQNGLPLTPNSISILGRAQRLKQINHNYLCQYLDVVRSKHERVIVVSEYCGTRLDEKRSKSPLEDYLIVRIMFQMCKALNYLHEYGIIFPNLEPKNILLDEHCNIKLFNYGLFYMANNSEYVTFPFGNVRYISPERLIGSKNNLKGDVWTIGIIIVELLLDCKLWHNLKPAIVMRRILSLCNNSNNIFEKIAREHNCYEKYLNIDPDIRNLLDSCLSISIKNRPTTEDIMTCKVFANTTEFYRTATKAHFEFPLFSDCLEKVYYLWQLAGGDVQVELKKEGLIRSEAPILSVPRVICLDGKIIGPHRSQSHLFDNRIVMLKLHNLTERLKHVAATTYFPPIYSQKFFMQTKTGMTDYPLVIKERDTEYQLYRVMLFSTLLKGYPFTRELIIREAGVDIPPLLRGKVWAALLNVIPNGSFEKIDKVTPNSTDRQIEVDIPRCHQYDELLSSPEGHRKLKRLLKAWVTSHPEYVYWQGLDSLTAPFLYLNFNNEELAFLSLFKFIPKYLHWFFLKDNSAIIKEYLSKFSQLTAFHEPALAKHLIGINFIPELFAIPWFLTMFSHVFPLHKIIHLWDKLLLGDNSYPLFIGIAVLKQLRTTLLNSGFNECILLFSDLPDIVMETCVVETQKMYNITPKSISWRKHVISQDDPTELDISNISLLELQNEICPRISARDFINLLINLPHRVTAIDLRAKHEFNRLRIPESLNIPFNSILLGDTRLESLNIPNLEEILLDKIVVIVSDVHENAVLFSKFLIDCAVKYVCIMHNGFDILQSSVHNILAYN